MGVITCFLLLGLFENNFTGVLGVLAFCVFWYGLLGWMVYSGYRSIRKVKKDDTKTDTDKEQKDG